MHTRGGIELGYDSESRWIAQDGRHQQAGWVGRDVCVSTDKSVCATTEYRATTRERWDEDGGGGISQWRGGGYVHDSSSSFRLLPSSITIDFSYNAALGGGTGENTNTGARCGRVVIQVA